MTPLSIMKYVVERLEGTAYEPWVNTLLFLLFATAVAAGVSLMLGRHGRSFVTKAILLVAKSLAERKGYAPEWNAFCLRVGPYVEFGSSIHFALMGLYSAALVTIALIIGHERAPWWAVPLAMAWILGSFWYMRQNLESASWAYHRIKQRRP